MLESLARVLVIFLSYVQLTKSFTLSNSTMSAKYVYQVASLPTPRIQWNENQGYCGETSTICASMAFGAYFSQYDMRSISANYASKAQSKTQYLVGVNDQLTAKSIKLNHAEWDSDIVDSARFLVWAKQQTKLGYIVTICVYTNEYLFYGDTDPTAGDDEYDHIVTVYQVSSNFDDDLYHEDDTITISDHALWNPTEVDPKYLFTYTFKDFQGTRRSANAKNGPIYTLPSGVSNYGIAHLGPVDEGNDLLPVRVETDKNFETPEIGRRSNDRPAANEVQLTVVVSGLEFGESYKLYMYNDENVVPTSSFNANAGVSVNSWNIEAVAGTNEATVVMTILSSDKAIFRCVRTNAP